MTFLFFDKKIQIVHSRCSCSSLITFYLLILFIDFFTSITIKLLLFRSVHYSSGFLRGWSFCKVGSAILLGGHFLNLDCFFAGGGGHFQKRKRYLGGHLMKSVIKKYFPVLEGKKSI